MNVLVCAERAVATSADEPSNAMLGYVGV